MPEQVLLDNDIAFKLACYQLADETVAATTINKARPAMLSVSRFVIPKKIATHKRVRSSATAQSALERLFRSVLFLEPTEDEIALAAVTEAAATRSGLELDSGESLLLAILYQRACTYLVTGDKRAVIAMAVVAKEASEGRVRCLEQLVVHLISQIGVSAVGTQVCAEPLIDTALSISFQCAAPGERSVESILAGLTSYIEYLRREAPGVLHDGPF